MSRPNIPGKDLRARVIGPVDGERASDRTGSNRDLDGRRSEFKTGNPRAPVKGAGCRVVSWCVPEGGVINWVDSQRAIIAPAITRAGLTAGAGNNSGFTLGRVLSGSVARATGVSDLRINRSAGSAVTEAIFPAPSIAMLPSQRQVVSG